LKQLFHIAPSPTEAQANDILVMEVGADYACYATGNTTAKTVNEIRYYTFPKGVYQTFHNIYEQAKANNGSFEKVVVCSAFPQAILVPDKLYSEDNHQNFLQPVYDIANDIILHDHVTIWRLHNVYAFPKNLHQITTGHFPQLEYIHAYSISLKNDTIRADQQIAVHFTTTQFSVKVKKGQRLLLMQTFSFQTPLDVVYVLLKIGTEMELKQEETDIVLSGLIDEQSDLYKELYNYFLHLQFAGIAEDKLITSDYPPHFFASIYNLASCVL
jgi:hypothetical protein